MFQASSSSMFGSASSSSIFGGTSAPAFGANPAGASATPSIFGASSSAPAFGSSVTPPFGASSGPSLFGGSSTPSLFGPGSTPAFGAAPSSPFGASSTPSLFGATSTPSLQGTTLQSPGLFGGASSSSPFGQTQVSPFGQPQQQPSPFGQTQASPFGQPQQQPSPFGQTQASPFGQPQQQPSPFGQLPQAPLFGQTQSQASPFGMTSFGQQPTPGFGQAQPSIFGTPQQSSLQQGAQLMMQMAPVAPVSVPLPDRELQAIIDAYKDDPGNPKYAFKHLLLSVTDPSTRAKPAGVSDVMWAEAINKLEGMDSAERERLWPELVQGFKDHSKRLKMQDEALVADAQRLQTTETNVKLLQRHFEVDTVPWIQKLRQKEQQLQRRLLKMMRIVEGLEGKGFRMPLTKGEGELGVRLRNLSLQLQGSRAELPRRVDALLSSSRLQATAGGISHTDLLGNGKIEEESLVGMHKVLGQQTEAIARLVTVLKRDIRDMEIIDVENRNRDVKLKEGLGQSKLSMHRVTF